MTDLRLSKHSLIAVIPLIDIRIGFSAVFLIFLLVQYVYCASLLQPVCTVIDVKILLVALPIVAPYLLVNVLERLSQRT
jgi:hypothetical protein